MTGLNPMPNPVWTENTRRSFINMGFTAENMANRCGIGRAAQDEFALSSHIKATTAGSGGRQAQEILPITGPDAVVGEALARVLSGEADPLRPSPRTKFGSRAEAFLTLVRTPTTKVSIQQMLATGKSLRNGMKAEPI